MRIKLRPLVSGLSLATILAAAPALYAQVTGDTTVTTDTNGKKQENVTLSVSPKDKKKGDRIQQTKDTKAAEKKEKKLDPLVGKDSTLPDKQLYDKAVAQIKSGHFDVGRLDLQTLLNTYPDSQYQMRAKLAVADAWYREGGSAALTQAEQEYKDFITFFPNVPEAAEAQLRVGDIYFKQMDVPDRDYTKGTHAEEEYRTMLKQYPDAPKELTTEARQKLREVQEVMAERDAELGAFYATHANWAATIARYQTVIDTYPLYSHMDDALIGVGDAYEAQANAVRALPVCDPKVPLKGCMPEGPKAALLVNFDGKASAAYRDVVLNHAAAPHVEDAKERLAGMNLPIPTPTPEQVAASEALEGSRAQYNLQKRLALFFVHKPDTVTAAQIGDPPLDDAPATYAPSVVKSLTADYTLAFNPNAAAAAHTPAAAPSTTDGEAPAAPVAPVAVAPLALSDVPGPGEGTGGSTGVMTTAPGGGGGGANLGVEVVTPGSTANTPSDKAPSSSVSDRPAATGAQDPNYGLTSVAPKNAGALPAIEKPADAPDQVNDVAGKAQPAATVQKDANGKPIKDSIDKTDESSSKKKPKKGLDKLNPF